MNISERPPFRIALTGDFYDDVGQPKFSDLGLDCFTSHSNIQVSRFSEHRPEISPDQLTGLQGVIVLTPRVTAESLVDCEDLLAVGRFGVGYDTIDVDACTANNVLALITPGAVNRPVAEATVGWMIALTHHMLRKDWLVRTGHWDDRAQYMGCELRDRTLGVIGLGGIGQSLLSLLRGFGMRQPIAFDPYLPEEVFHECGVRSVSLEELLSSADFVSLHCPLNSETTGLIGDAELRLMKRNAYLLNTSRGGLVDEIALYDALSKGRIAGAALDCFEDEPITVPHRLGDLENVILAPHSIAWTEELFRDIGRIASQSMCSLSEGQNPEGVLNPELFSNPSFREKWASIINMSESLLVVADGT